MEGEKPDCIHKLYVQTEWKLQEMKVLSKLKQTSQLIVLRS